LSAAPWMNAKLATLASSTPFLTCTSSAVRWAAVNRLVVGSGPSAGATLFCDDVLEVQKHLDRSALVHRTVPFGCPLDREREVEHLAGVNLPVPDQIDQVG